MVDTTTSVMYAATTGKSHGEVLRAIELAMRKVVGFAPRKNTYAGIHGRRYPQYVLTAAELAILEGHFL